MIALKLGIILPYHLLNSATHRRNLSGLQELYVLEPYYDDGTFGVVCNVGNPLADLAYSNDYRSGVRGVGNLLQKQQSQRFRFPLSYGIDASFNKAERFTPAYTIIT